MRKLYLIVLMLFVSASVYAQRTIDWSVDEILAPTELRSDASTNTTSMRTHIVLKNLGSDEAKTGDSMFVRIRVANTNNQVVLAYPGANSFLPVPLTRNVAVNDTIHFIIPLSLNTTIPSSVNIRYEVTCLLINRGTADPIAQEDQTTTANNFKIEDITWYNSKGWGVSVGEVTNLNDIEVYPNPAVNEVNIKWNIGHSNTDCIVRVLDLNGRVIIEETASSIAFGHTLDIAKLENGIYIVEIKNGDNVVTQKLQVNK